MQNYIDTFFSIVTDEFGNQLNFSNIENDGFSGVICFGENSADVHINKDFYSVYNVDLNEEEQKMLDAFAWYVQKEMKEQQFFSKNIKTTENGRFH